MFPLRDTIPSRRFPLAVWLLVLVNGLVFFYEFGLPADDLDTLFRHYAVVPRAIELHWTSLLAEPRAYLPLFTSMFLHGGLFHVLGNLWMLVLFGDNVEDRMGRTRFLVFYLLCGLIAGLVHVGFNADSSVPTVGASGAIAGVMGAYFLLYPKARVITLVPLLFYPLFVELPAFVFLGVWFLSQVFSGVLSVGEPGEAGGIAFQAHVGGFVAGVLLHRLFLRNPAPGS